MPVPFTGGEHVNADVPKRDVAAHEGEHVNADVPRTPPRKSRDVDHQAAKIGGQAVPAKKRAAKKRAANKRAAAPRKATPPAPPKAPTRAEKRAPVVAGPEPDATARRADPHPHAPTSRTNAFPNANDKRRG